MKITRRQLIGMALALPALPAIATAPESDQHVDAALMPISVPYPGIPEKEEWKRVEVLVSGLRKEWREIKFEEILAYHKFRFVGSPVEYISKSDAAPCDPPGNFIVDATVISRAMIRSDN